MPNLKINLLGPPEILWEQERFNINRRIPRTLLYFLATQNNLIGRGKLLSIFWEDTSPPIARRRLRESLSRIRAAIPLDDFIVIENDLVGLNHPGISVDLKKFREIQDGIGSSLWVVPTDQLLPEEMFQSAKSAVDLWRGTHFLEGIELPKSTFLDDWRYQTNLNLTQNRVRLLARISDHYFSGGQFEEGLRYSKLAVDSDPYNEELHYRVLRFLIEMDRNQEASQYYLSTTKLLKDELDVRPSQQLVSMYRQIQRSTSTSSISPRTDWRLLASIRTPFVGREDEFNQIKTAMEKSNAIFISGDSGLGKTRLVQEFCGLNSTSRRIISSYCRPAEINLPFQPFIELLRNSVSSSDWKNYPITWTEPLSTILPEILPNSSSHKSPVLSISPDQNRSTLFEAIRQVFLMISRNSDLILFIDDLHWSDTETLSTIAYLIERAPFTENAFMILAARSEDTNQSLNDILFANHTASNLINLELGKLNQDEISGLGRYVLGYPLEKDMVNQLDLETGGNPFIVLETLRSIRGIDTISGLSGISGQPKLPLADSVYSLVKERLGQLSPAAREICENAAIIGIEFDPILISQANKQPLSITARAIEELKQRNIIESVHRPNQEITWRFIHDKIRESIIRDTSRIRLRILHESIANTLEAKFGSQTRSQAALLARHYEYAGRATTALNYWLQAAQWARQLFSSSEALRILSHAENIVLTSSDSINDELIHDFYVEWTELSYEIEDSEQIRKHNNRLYEIGQAKKSKLLIGTALVGNSVACLVENEFEDGLAYTNQAIPYLKTTDNAFEIMSSHTNRGVYLYMLGRLNEAIESFELALSLGNADEDTSILRGMANAHYHLGLSQTLAGWPELGLKNAKTSLELANDIGHHHIAVTAYLASSLAYYFMADYKKARRDNTIGIEIAKKLQANRMLGYLYVAKAFLEYSAGNLGSAYELSDAIYNIGEQHNHHELQSIALRIRGDIYMLLQSYEEALQEFQLGSEFGRHDFWGIDNLVRKGYSEIQTGQLETGMINLHRGIDLARAAGFGMVEIRGMQLLSIAHASRKEWQLTGKITDQLDQMARIRGLPMVGILAKIFIGMGEFDEKKSESSLDQLDYLLKMLGDEDQPYIAIRILIQKFMLKKRSNIDPHREVMQIREILDRCEKLAYPQKIQAAFQRYKGEIKYLISN